MRGAPRLLVVFTLAMAVVIGVVISLAIGSWWFLVLAVAVHATATLLVIGAVGRRLDEGYKPDPLTEARIEEERSERDEPKRDDEPRMAI
jgi:membrane protein implicated in regulation of membrane protease activity